MKEKSSKIKGVGKIYTLVALFLGVLIVFVSMARASFEIIAKENNEGKLRVRSLEVEVKKDNGEKIKEIYQLPEIKTLPNNVFYGLKELRDYLWLLFARSNYEKAKIALIIADKNLAESMVMEEEDYDKLALASGEKAVEKLDYAWTLLWPGRDNMEAELIRSFPKAVRAYEQVIDKLGKKWGIDINKYEEIKNKIKALEEKVSKMYEE